jgi:hypothetical protein
MEFGRDDPLVRQCRAVCRGEHLVAEALEAVTRHVVTLLGVEDKADRRVLAGTHPVRAGVTVVTKSADAVCRISQPKKNARICLTFRAEHLRPWLVLESAARRTEPGAGENITNGINR